MSELALRLIEENKRTKDTFLDLGNCGLKNELPEELLECVWLEGLSLGNYNNNSKLNKWFETKNKKYSNIFEGQELKILQNLTQLLSLDLGYIQIQDYSFLQNLTYLQYLDLRYNQIQDYSFLHNLTELQSLDLSDNQIQDISFLQNLIHLKSLDLSSNQIQDYTSLQNLIQLQSLDLRYNQIHDITFLQNLTQLESLYLSDNRIHAINFLQNLTQLQSLYLNSNRIHDISSLQNFTQLQYLDLRSNKVQDITPLQNLVQLQYLDLHSNKIQDISSLQHIPQLRSLNLSNNQIKDIGFLQNLSQLQSLGLSNNQIQNISFLKKLTLLQSLDLSNNQIQNISFLKKLSLLQSLDLSNNQIQDIFSLLDLIKKGLNATLDKNNGHLCLFNNPITIPPKSIISNGNDAIIRFFENELETKYEGKLLIVGEPEAGKTTLQNRLLIPTYKVPNNTQSTVGIQVKKWLPKYPKNRKITMQVNVWDFGGQEIQYLTHQFFLTPDALYVLLTSARKDLDNLDYWFNIIRLLGKNENNQHSKLLVVANEINMKPVTHFAEKNFKDRYADLDFECFSVNFATNQNKDGRFKSLEFKLRENLYRLPSMGRKLPVKWGVIREKLEERDENSISIEKYLEICATEALDSISAKDLSGYLHTIGEVIHFQNDLEVRDFIILNPKWAVDAVYIILKDNSVKNGHFTQQQVDKIWHKIGYTDEECKRLLKLMAKDNFEVSYPLPESNTDFIAPQLLADTPPNYDWDSEDTLKFRYSYAFMPKGIMTRFIVRLHEDITYPDGEGLVWKNGVVLRDEYTGFMAQVKETKIQEPGLERKVIDIEIMGKKGHRKTLLKKVCKNIEKIHNEIFAGLSFERLIPCNCPDCEGTENPTFYDYSELVELYNEGLDARCRKAKIKEVNITDIFEEIVDIDWKIKYIKSSLEGRAGLIINKPLEPFIFQDPFQATRKDKKIFFSYAWGDDKEKDGSREDIVNELYDSLKSDNFEVVRDKVDLGYKGSISEFMRTIGRGDCVIVAISDKYLRSPNCMFELYEAFRNSKLEKKAFVERIIPIRVEEINLSPTARGEYRKYWNEKKMAWNEYIREHSDDTSASEKEEQLRVKSIVDNLGTIFEILNDINSSTMALLSKDDFAEIKKAIKKIQANN